MPGTITGDNNQVTINITDIVPPDNMATIDKNGMVGNTYSKAQFDQSFSAKANEIDTKIENIQQMVESDFRGTLKPSDAAPTEDGTYKPAVSSSDDKPSDPASTADWGKVYANAGNLRAKDGYETLFYKKGSVWTRSETKMPNVAMATDTEFKSKISGKSFSPKQLFDNVIGDFNFPNTQVSVEMMKPESAFSIGKANQFLPTTMYWSPVDSLYADMQFITSVDLWFREISAAFNIYIFARNNSSAPEQTISVSPPSSVGQKTFVFDQPINNATHKIYVSNGFSYYEYTNANATEWISNGVKGVNANVILGVKFNGYKMDGAGSKKIAERLDALDTAVLGLDVIKVYKGSSTYPTITSAVNAVKNLSGRKTIHVYPGIYEETIDLYKLPQNLTVEIIGIGSGVKVLKRTGDYYSPPMQVNCNSYFENITFESTSELGQQAPSSYAVHSDVNFSNVATPAATIEFYRCNFITSVPNNSTFGAGSWQGASLIFRFCKFEKKNTVASGSMYWHNAVANATAQRLEMYFCEVYSNGGSTIHLHDANQTNGGNTNPALSEAKVLFIGNTFYSGDTAVNASLKLQEITRTTGALVGNIFLDPRSHGNNINALNA